MPNPTGINQYTKGGGGMSDKEVAETRVPGGRTMAEDTSARAHEATRMANSGTQSASEHHEASLKHEQAARYQRAVGNFQAAHGHDGLAQMHAAKRDEIRSTSQGAQLAERSHAAIQARAGRHGEILRGIAASKSNYAGREVMPTAPGMKALGERARATGDSLRFKK